MGLRHWLDHAEPPIDNSTVVVLLDPDMIFLRPITVKIRGLDNLIVGKYVKEPDLIEEVAEGYPVAQLYGLGAPWTNDKHKKFNRTWICGADSPCVRTSTQFGERHFAVGPPYIGLRADMERIAETWTRLVPR